MTRELLMEATVPQIMRSPTILESDQIGICVHIGIVVARVRPCDHILLRCIIPAPVFYRYPLFLNLEDPIFVIFRGSPCFETARQVLHQARPMFLRISSEGVAKIFDAPQFCFDLLDLTSRQRLEVLFSLIKLLAAHIVEEIVAGLVRIGAEAGWDYIMIFHSEGVEFDKGTRHRIRYDGVRSSRRISRSSTKALERESF